MKYLKYHENTIKKRRHPSQTTPFTKTFILMKKIELKSIYFYYAEVHTHRFEGRGRFVRET